PSASSVAEQVFDERAEQSRGTLEFRGRGRDQRQQFVHSKADLVESRQTYGLVVVACESLDLDLVEGEVGGLFQGRPRQVARNGADDFVEGQLGDRGAGPRDRHGYSPNAQL